MKPAEILAALLPEQVPGRSALPLPRLNTETDFLKRDANSDFASLEEALSVCGAPDYLYVLEADTGPKNTGAYKIGRSRDPHRRLTELQKQCPIGFRLIFIVPCEDARPLEACCHTILDDWRLTGEWFLLEREMIEVIQRWAGGLTASIMGHDTDSVSYMSESELEESYARYRAWRDAEKDLEAIL